MVGMHGNRGRNDLSLASRKAGALTRSCRAAPAFGGALMVHPMQ